MKASALENAYEGNNHDLLTQHASLFPSRAAGRQIPRPADCFGGSSFFRHGTAWQRKEIARRNRILERFRDLTEAGLSRIHAARVLAVGYTSIWRWLKFGVVPQTSQCGRRSLITDLEIPIWIVCAVQRLQAMGVAHETAWRTMARDPRCPADLEKFVSARRTLPPSLLKVSRVNRRRVTKIEGRDFTMITE